MKTTLHLGMVIIAASLAACASPQKHVAQPTPTPSESLDREALDRQWISIKKSWSNEQRRAMSPGIIDRVSTRTDGWERRHLVDLYRSREGRPIFFIEGEVTEIGSKVSSMTRDAWTHGVTRPAQWPELTSVRQELEAIDRRLSETIASGLSNEDLQRLRSAGATTDLDKYIAETSPSCAEALIDIEALEMARTSLVAELDIGMVVSLWKLARATRPKIRVRRRLDPKRDPSGVPLDLLTSPGENHHLAAPINEDYERLRAAFAHYWTLHKTRPQWNLYEVLPERLKIGRSHRSVPRLRQRLFEEGFSVELKQGPEATKMDAQLSKALGEFQFTRGLKITGELNLPTVRALSVPTEKLLERLHLGLTQWHDSRSRLDEFHIRVNISRFQVQLVRGRDIEHRLMAIVGKPWTQTPRFDGHVEQVVVHPWWRGTRENRQAVPPGPKNPLGVLSLRIAPTRKLILLHGTNEPRLFERPYRAYSHGCVRVPDPVALARLILDEDKGPETSADLPDLFAVGDTVPVKLARRIPVFLEYNTTWVNETTGRVHFTADIYRNDSYIQRHNELPSLAIESWPNSLSRHASAR